MNKEKLQLCVSFKHTKEEEDLYFYIMSKADKSVFIKNLIRSYKNGDLINSRMDKSEQILKEVNHNEKPQEINHIHNGKYTKNKFLA